MDFKKEESIKVAQREVIKKESDTISTSSLQISKNGERKLSGEYERKEPEWENASPSAEISQAAKKILVQRQLEQRQLEEAEAQHIDVKQLDEFEIEELEKKDIKKWIKQIQNGISAQHEEIKELADMFLFWAEQQEADANIAQTNLKAIGKEINKKSKKLPESKGNISKLVALVNAYLNNQGIDEPDLVNENEPNVDPEVKTIEKNREAFFNLVDQNSLYDEGDKLIRKLEYYRTYETKVLPLTDEIGKIKYRYRMVALEKKLEDFQRRKEIVQNQKKILEKLIKSNDVSDQDKDEARKTLKDLMELRAYNNWFASSSLYKNNLFSLDEKKDRLEIRKADETLNQETQIKKVREIDSWLLKRETSSYKEKSFLAQFMGCSIRERLAMYLCVETNFKMMDQSALVFSQLNYEPNITLIEKNLKRFLGMGFNWNKMYKAYEFVTNNSEFIDSVIKEVEEDAVSETYRRDEEALVKEARGDKLGEMDLSEVDRQITSVSKEVFKMLKTLRRIEKPEEGRNGLLEEGPDDNFSPEVLQEHLQKLRKLADKKAQLEKDPKIASAFAGMATCLKYYDYGNAGYGVLSNLAAWARKADWYEDDSGVGLTHDGGDYVLAYASTFTNLLKFSQNMYNLCKSGSDMSDSAIVKSAAGLVQSGTTLVDSSFTAYRDLLQSGTWAGGYRIYREKLAESMAARAEEGLPAVEFNANAHTTCQVLGSVVTVGSAVIDYYNIDRSRKARNTIREQIRNRRVSERFDEQNEFKVNETYKKEHYQLAMANLVKRLDVRKGLSTTLNLVSNISGYAKYVFAVPTIGLITGGITSGISLATKIVDWSLKRKSNHKTVDEFLDLDKMLVEYKKKNRNVDITNEEVRESFRRNAMLQLGFANRETFLVHVRGKISDMMHNVLENARTHRNQRDEARPIETIVRALGLKVDYETNKIPKAKQIAAKLAL